MIEHEEIKARLFDGAHAGLHLIARLKMAEIGVEGRFHRRTLARQEVRKILEPKRHIAIEARLHPGVAVQQPERHELVQLRQRPQHGDARVEVRARAEIDVLAPSLIQCAMAT